ncbi:hypothetical protein DFAR_1910007 [Desulfarculales bacterium]
MEARRRAGPFIEALIGLGSCLILGGIGGDDGLHLNLRPQPDLAQALDYCSPELRPRACLWLAGREEPPSQGALGLALPGTGPGPGRPRGALARQPRPDG